MIGWIVLGLFLLIALLLVGRVLVDADPKALAKGLRIGGATIFGLIATFFALTGRLALASPLAILATLFLRGGGRSPFSGFPGLGGHKPSPGQHSEISTRFLRMVLDHDSGEMTGTILEGAYQGVGLETLNFSQLTEIYKEFEENDGESTTLLVAYLERVHAAEWSAFRNTSAGAPGSGSGQSYSGSEGAMTPEEARSILGLGGRATAMEIKVAHKKLMKKMHPDQGGSTYLASKINRAKEILLDSINQGPSA